MAEPIDSYTSDLDDTSTVSDDDDLPGFAGITAEMKVELKNRGYLRVSRRGSLPKKRAGFMQR